MPRGRTRRQPPTQPGFPPHLACPSNPGPEHLHSGDSSDHRAIPFDAGADTPRFWTPRAVYPTFQRFVSALWKVGRFCSSKKEAPDNRWMGDQGAGLGGDSSSLLRGVLLRAGDRRTAGARETVRRALRAGTPPSYSHAPAGSVFDEGRAEGAGVAGEFPLMPATVLADRVW